MGERCGCVSAECTCAIFQGEGVIIQGTGSKTNPHIIEIGPNATRLVGVGSSYLGISVSGQGQPTSPYVISGTKSLLSPPATPLRIHQFVGAMAYQVNKPAGCTLMEIVLIGGGAGGGGSYTFFGGSRRGGNGGDGGGRVHTRFNVASAARVVWGTVGSGGAGSSHTELTSTPGSPGGATDLWVGPTFGNTVTSEMYLQAAGGGPSVGGAGTQPGQSFTTTTGVVQHLGAGAGGRGWTENPGPSPQTFGGQRPAGLYTTDEETLRVRAGGHGGDGGWIGPGIPGQAPGGGGGGGSVYGAGAPGGRGADGAAWIIFY